MAFLDRFKSKPVHKVIGPTGGSGKGLQTVNWDKLGVGVYNPDSISVSMYKKMSMDATVRAGYNLIKFAILSRNWKIIAPSKAKKALPIIDSLKYTFEHMDGRLSGSMSNVLTSLLYGFSVSEVVFDMFKQGKYSGKVGIRKIKGLDPETIKFRTNKRGDLKQVLQSMEGSFNSRVVKLPIDRLIIHSNEKEFGNYYGTSRLRTVYEHWFIKRVVTRFWNVSLERFGTPIVVGTVPTTHDLDQMKEVLASLQSKSSLAKLDGWEIEALETGIGRSSGGDFKGCIDYHNSQILRGLLVPGSLLGEQSGGSSGSFAKSKVDFELFQVMLRSLENDLCGIIEKYLIQPLVFFNFGEQESFPQFVFEPLTKAEFLELAKVFALLVRNGVVASEETWIRDMLRVPQYSEASIDRDQAKAQAAQDKRVELPTERREQTITQKTPGGGTKTKPKVVKPSTGPTQQIKTPKQRTQTV